MEKEFNQKEYIQNYDKEHYGKFAAKLKKAELEKVNQFLKDNNVNKREFVLKASELIKIDNLKKQVKEIILKYHISNEFSFPPKLSNGKKKNLNNGIVVYSYTFPVLESEKMLVLRIEFNNEILYYGVVNYNRILQILEEIERLDTSF